MDRKTGVLEIPMQASAAVTRDRFVTQTGNQTVAQTGTAGQRTLGVAQLSISTTEATAGKSCAVQVLGVALVEAGAAVARGDRVTTDATARAITAGAAQVPAGVALKAATAAGQKIGVLLTPGLPAV